MKTSRGFSPVELLVALAVLALVAVMLTMLSGCSSLESRPATKTPTAQTPTEYKAVGLVVTVTGIEAEIENTNDFVVSVRKLRYHTWNGAEDVSGVFVLQPGEKQEDHLEFHQGSYFYKYIIQDATGMDIGLVKLD